MLWLLRRKTLKWGQRALVAVLMAIFYRPKKRAFLYGDNDLEENLIVTALALSAHYSGSVVVLSTDPERTRASLAYLATILGGEPERVEARTASLLGGVWLFATSELVFGTHFKFSGPAGLGRRLIVNLTHGTGPKEVRNASSGSTVLVACATAWLKGQATSQRMPAAFSSVTGNPRQDLLRHGWADRTRVRTNLDLDPFAKVIVWMPTYRASSRASYRDPVVEGIAFEDSREVEMFATNLAELAARNGVQVVVKTHPMDDTDFARFGLRSITSTELWEMGASLYEFVGQADALISDYSSIWVDYLETGRTIGFFLHDSEAFISSRGLLPGADIGDLTRALRVDAETGLSDLVRAVAAGGVYLAPEIDRLRATIGFIGCQGPRRLQMLADLRAIGLARYNHDFGLDVAAHTTSKVRA